MPSFFERIGLTGGKKAPAEEQPNQLQNPGLPEEEWKRIMEVASNDPEKMRDLVASLVDYQAAQSLVGQAGGAKNYGKEAEKSAARRANEIKQEKAVELNEAELQRKAQYAKLMRLEEEAASRKKTEEIIAGINAAFAADEARKKTDEERQHRRGLEGIN